MAKPKQSKKKVKSNNKFVLIILVAASVGIAVYSLVNNSDDKREDIYKKYDYKNESYDYKHVKACNVFIENSGSMDGYVNAINSQFKSDLNSLISSISIIKHPSTGQELVDTVRLNYVNSLIIPIDKEISAFTEGLSIQSFRNHGGKRSSTSLQDLLDKVQKETEYGEVSILVSDMILGLMSGQSPESVSTNIETSLRKQLSLRPSWTIVVWRMISDFDGKYYQHGGLGTVYLKTKRPYYVIFMGDRDQLLSLLSENHIPKNLPLWQNCTHRLTLEPSYSSLEYRIEPNAVIGKIRLNKNDESGHIIADAERGSSPEGKQGLAFDIKIKLPLFLQDENLMFDIHNYLVYPKDYSISRVWKTKPGEIKLRLQSDKVTRGEIRLAYTQRIPSWFETIHSNQNSDINDPDAINSTYGIKYILEGLKRPYETISGNLMELSVYIN